MIICTSMAGRTLINAIKPGSTWLYALKFLPSYMIKSTPQRIEGGRSHSETKPRSVVNITQSLTLVQQFKYF